MDTGDLIEFRANAVLGELIRLRTGQDVNHSGLVVAMTSAHTGTKRRYIHEAMGDGVDTDYLSTVLSKYDGEAFWYQLLPDFRVEIPAIEAKAFELAGTAYDYIGLMKNLVERTDLHSGAIFCSAYVYACNGGAGIAPWPGELPKVMPRWADRVQIL